MDYLEKQKLMEFKEKIEKLNNEGNIKFDFGNISLDKIDDIMKLAEKGLNLEKYFQRKIINELNRDLNEKYDYTIKNYGKFYLINGVNKKKGTKIGFLYDYYYAFKFCFGYSNCHIQKNNDNDYMIFVDDDKGYYLKIDVTNISYYELNNVKGSLSEELGIPGLGVKSKNLRCYRNNMGSYTLYNLKEKKIKIACYDNAYFDNGKISGDKDKKLIRLVKREKNDEGKSVKIEFLVDEEGNLYFDEFEKYNFMINGKKCYIDDNRLLRDKHQEDIIKAMLNYHVMIDECVENAKVRARIKND